jgi:hypothetical protein
VNRGGVLFGSSGAHQAVRKTIADDQQLDGMISRPSSVFKPYAGVSTAILIFTKTDSGGTDHVWSSYAIAHARVLSTVREITVRLSCGVSFQLAVDGRTASWKLTPLIPRTVLRTLGAGTILR